MPVSERKLLANRLNALKSTGPKTADGKARVRMNRLRHGLRASDPVLPEEEAASFYLSKSEIEEHLEPKWPLEWMLCGQIAEVSWRLMRIGRMEVRIFEKSLEDESALACDSCVDALARQLDRPDHALVTLSRYERGLRNTLSRLLTMYKRVKDLYGQAKPCPAYETAVQSHRKPRRPSRNSQKDQQLHAEAVEAEFGFDRDIKATDAPPDTDATRLDDSPLNMDVTRLDDAPTMSQIEETEDRLARAEEESVIEASPAERECEEASEGACEDEPSPAIPQARDARTPISADAASGDAGRAPGLTVGTADSEGHPLPRPDCDAPGDLLGSLAGDLLDVAAGGRVGKLLEPNGGRFHLLSEAS